MKKFLAFLLCLCMLMPSAACAASTYALMQQCAVYAENGEYAKALACFELAQMADPDMKYDPLLMGYVWLNNGDLENAQRCADMAVAETPVNPDTWRLVADVALRKGDQSAAEKAQLYVTLLSNEEAEQMTAENWLEACEAFAETGDYEAALACSELARMIDPALPYDPAVMAVVFLMTGYPAQARECADAVVAVAPHSVEAWQLKYDVHAALGDQEDAAQAELYMTILAEVGLQNSTVDNVIAAFFAENAAPVVRQEPFSADITEVPYSISPDGTLGLYLTADSIIIAPRDNSGEVIRVELSSTRGAGDPYGKLERVMARPITTLASSCPAIWSQDGRYVTFCPWETVIMEARMNIDPFVIDTQTGEWIVLEAFDKTTVRKGGGAVFQACFSEDGGMLYYVVFGGPEGYRYSLRSADLATGETTILFATEDDFFPTYPSLCSTADGSLLNLEYHNKNVYPHGVNLFRPGKDGWTRTMISFDISGRYWQPIQLEYSADSGYGLILGRLGIDPLAFKRFTLENGSLTGADVQYVLIGEEKPELVAMTADEYLAWIDGLAAQTGADMSDFSATIPNLWRISAMRLSPGGDYALIAGGRSISEPFLLCVRLSDMQTMALNVPEGFAGLTLGTALTYGAFRPGMLWCETGEIITVMDNQRVIFTLQAQE